MNGKATPYLDLLNRDGFVVVKDIITKQQLETLRAAASETTNLARSGGWPHVRTVGKHFPPWKHDPTSGIWGVQHLMNPELSQSDVFTEVYFSEHVLAVVRELLECEDEDLVMELFNMLVRPEKNFELRWHRDGISAEASPEEEMERLSRPAYHAQYNLALWEDESLILVPGSHKRARTDVERNAEPFDHLPEELVVTLHPGDIAFYNHNIVHRGVYDSTRERMTLHGSVGHVGGGELRATNVLQHGVREWVDRCDLGRLGERERRRAEGMRKRLVKLGSETGEVGYSLQG